METSTGHNSLPPLESLESSGVSLITAPCIVTRVHWDELRQISQVVQQDLNDAEEFEKHPEYETVFDMWQKELHGVPDVKDNSTMSSTIADEQPPVWYSFANDYWQDETNCSLDDNGVLGGFAHIAPVDIADSRSFVSAVLKTRKDWKANIAVDCGAGIGRVSKHLLLPLFQQVDLVEQSERLLRNVPYYILGSGHGRGRERFKTLYQRVGHLYCMGLQDFHPIPSRYDLIWLQWVSVHLTDVDYIHFLKRCRSALQHPHGWIGIKENVLLKGLPYEIDRQDSSITRYVCRYFEMIRNANEIML